MIDQQLYKENPLKPHTLEVFKELKEILRGLKQC